VTFTWICQARSEWIKVWPPPHPQNHWLIEQTLPILLKIFNFIIDNCLIDSCSGVKPGQNQNHLKVNQSVVNIDRYRPSSELSITSIVSEGGAESSPTFAVLLAVVLGLASLLVLVLVLETSVDLLFLWVWTHNNRSAVSASSCTGNPRPDLHPL